ncbi:hypothetical protein [uncultured Cohaesibacter sp.]|uniref:hypothetical protein n=1 Tax=uncultured Cohaesibacter sp. TaxID=1002546 RepID=UPI0029C63C89|nr:hypothetical protein [uncultured Cohaesibacter sp.]
MTEAEMLRRLPEVGMVADFGQAAPKAGLYNETVRIYGACVLASLIRWLRMKDREGKETAWQRLLLSTMIAIF